MRALPWVSKAVARAGASTAGVRPSAIAVSAASAAAASGLLAVRACKARRGESWRDPAGTRPSATASSRRRSARMRSSVAPIDPERSSRIATAGSSWRLPCQARAGSHNRATIATTATARNPANSRRVATGRWAISRRCSSSAAAPAATARTATSTPGQPTITSEKPIIPPPFAQSGIGDESASLRTAAAPPRRGPDIARDRDQTLALGRPDW